MKYLSSNNRRIILESVTKYNLKVLKIKKKIKTMNRRKNRYSPGKYNLVRFSAKRGMRKSELYCSYFKKIKSVV